MSIKHIQKENIICCHWDFFFFVKTMSLLELIRYRVNMFTHVPYWSLCDILYVMSPPAVMSP